MIQRHRRERPKRADGCGGFFDDGGGDAELAFAFEGSAAGEHLVEHGAKGEDVAAAVEFATLYLLGRHVLKGSDDGPFFRYRRLRLDCRYRGQIHGCSWLC